MRLSRARSGREAGTGGSGREAGTGGSGREAGTEGATWEVTRGANQRCQAAG